MSIGDVEKLEFCQGGSPRAVRQLPVLDSRRRTSVDLHAFDCSERHANGVCDLRSALQQLLHLLSHASGLFLSAAADHDCLLPWSVSKLTVHDQSAESRWSTTHRATVHLRKFAAHRSIPTTLFRCLR